MLDKSINIRFVELRKFNQISQQKLADKLKVSKQTINNIENIKYNPSIEVIGKLMKTYPDLNPKWLILGEGTMFVEKGADVVNEGDTPYGDGYKDKLIGSLERENELLRREVERLSGDGLNQKSAVG